MDNEELKRKLQEIQDSKPPSIENEVAREALYHDNIESFFSDLLQYGCICGMIGSLIYYVDTHKFFDKHYAEIEELRIEYEANTGTQLVIKGDLKNFLAWYSFEEVAYRMVEQLNVKIL